jgi:hypothetical protein
MAAAAVPLPIARAPLGTPALMAIVAIVAIVAPAFNSDHLNYVLPWLFGCTFLHPGQVHAPEIAQKSGACTILW